MDVGLAGLSGACRDCQHQAALSSEYPPWRPGAIGTATRCISADESAKCTGGLEWRQSRSLDALDITPAGRRRVPSSGRFGYGEFGKAGIILLFAFWIGTAAVLANFPWVPLLRTLLRAAFVSAERQRSIS